MAELRPTADLYAYFGGKAGAGYQGSHLVGGNEKQECAAGRHCPAGNPAGRPAFPRPVRLSIPAPPDGAGANRPDGGAELFAADFRRGKAIQRIQLVYPAVNKIAVNGLRVFLQFQLYVFDKGIPHTLLYVHHHLSINCILI
jgi:hypothetical protein